MFRQPSIKVSKFSVNCKEVFSLKKKQTKNLLRKSLTIFCKMAI